MTDTIHRATNTEIVERVGKLETRFDSLETMLARIESNQNKPYSGPTWVQIASLMLAGGTALSTLIGIFVMAVVNPIKEDTQLSMTQVIALSRTTGMLEERLKTIVKDQAITDTEARANSAAIADLNGRLGVYEKWEYENSRHTGR